MLPILRAAWSDSVWSKVIATGITAALASVGAIAAHHWRRVADLLAIEIAVPGWLALGAAMLLALLGIAVMVLWRGKPPALDQEEAQPNAILVARVPPERL